MTAPVCIHPCEHPVHGLVPGAGHLPGLPAHQVVDGVRHLGQGELRWAFGLQFEIIRVLFSGLVFPGHELPFRILMDLSFPRVPPVMADSDYGDGG